MEFVDTGSAERATTTTILDDVQTLELSGTQFVMTGKFDEKPRAAFAKRLTDYGAIQKRQVTNLTGLLIVGGRPSRDWKYASSGIKIAQAIRIKEKGGDVLILSEERVRDILTA